jgi:hypothetical protein
MRYARAADSALENQDLEKNGRKYSHFISVVRWYDVFRRLKLVPLSQRSDSVLG